jgi:antitoxin component YwqK of YwqJK toxin-antitoxin module
MLYIVVSIISLTFSVTPAYADKTQNSPIRSSLEIEWHRLLNSKDLVYKRGRGYRKSTNVPFTGRITGSEEGYLNEGKWNGPYKSYYNTGQLEQRGSYHNAKKEGPWKSFRTDGNIISEGYYKNGQKEGTWKFYHLFGSNLQMVKSYKNGKKDGVFKSFYGNGNLMQKGSYKNGIPNGLWIFYEKNGRKVRNRKIY